MSGRWASSNRVAQLPANWNQLREAVKQRAGGQCEGRENGQRCPEQGTDCDHIHGRHLHVLSNLQWLCVDCHKKKTQREAREAAAAIRAKAHMPVGRHPGLI